MLALFLFEVFLSISFVFFWINFHYLLMPMYCIAFDSLFSKTSFVLCIPNPQIASSVFNLFFLRFSRDLCDSSVIS